MMYSRFQGCAFMPEILQNRKSESSLCNNMRQLHILQHQASRLYFVFKEIYR